MGYGTSRRAGTESLAYHGGGWMVVCSDSGAGGGLVCGGAGQAVQGTEV